MTGASSLYARHPRAGPTDVSDKTRFLPRSKSRTRFRGRRRRSRGSESSSAGTAVFRRRAEPSSGRGSRRTSCTRSRDSRAGLRTLSRSVHRASASTVRDDGDRSCLSLVIGSRTDPTGRRSSHGRRTRRRTCLLCLSPSLSPQSGFSGRRGRDVSRRRVGRRRPRDPYRPGTRRVLDGRRRPPRPTGTRSRPSPWVPSPGEGR